MEEGEGGPPPGGGGSGSGSSGGWRDITEDCRRAASALDVGELLCGSDFSLYDAMSALELMDPKMDEALQEPVESIPSRLSRGALPTATLTVAQVAAVATRLLAHEAAFHTGGASLLDSLFLCLYAHAPALTALCSTTGVTRADAEDGVGAGPVVRDAVTTDPALAPALAMLALVLGALKTTHGLRKIVLDADIYEEEDCTPNAFGLYLADNLSQEDALFLLAHAESLLPSSSSSDDAASLTLLQAQLRLRARLLEAVAALNAFTPHPGDPPPTSSPHTHLTTALTTALQTLRSLPLPTPTTTENDEPTAAAFAFDPGVTRALKGNAPRRSLRIPTDGEGVKGYGRMLEELMGAVAVLAMGWGATAEDFSLQRLRDRLEAYSLHWDPGVVPRSFLHMHLLKGDDTLLGQPQLSLRVAIAEHMAAVGVPVSLSLSPPGQHFIHTVVARTVADAMRSLCHNRARQRTRVEVLLQDIAVMQDHAAAADDEFGGSHELPPGAIQFLQNWTVEETLRAMQHYLLLGLELGLYSVGEVDQVLWYLDCLLTTRLQVLQSMARKREELEEAEARLVHEQRLKEAAAAAAAAASKGKGKGSPSPSKGGGGKKKGGKGGGGAGEEARREAVPPPPERPPPRVDDEPLQVAQLDLAALRLLCRGLHLSLTWLTRARNQPPTPLPDYCPWPERFRRRFAAFALLRHPEPLAYEDFAENVWSPEVGLERPFTQAQEALRGAKGLIEHALRVKDQLPDPDGHALCKLLARTAVGNAVALAQAERALGGAAGGVGRRVKVGVAWSGHRQLPVLSAAVGE